MTDSNLNWVRSNTYENLMITVKGWEEGKNGIMLKIRLWCDI